MNDNLHSQVCVASKKLVTFLLYNKMKKALKVLSTFGTVGLRTILTTTLVIFRHIYCIVLDTLSLKVVLHVSSAIEVQHESIFTVQCTEHR